MITYCFKLVSQDRVPLWHRINDPVELFEEAHTPECYQYSPDQC